MSVLDPNQKINLEFFDYSQGLDVDTLMWREELSVQSAWLKALCEAAYVTKEESNNLEAALKKLASVVESGKFEWKVIDEDIHMNFERWMTEECGDLGKKIHLGRSRNDLVATTQRLFCRNQLTALSEFAIALTQALNDKALEYIDVVVPGMTHVQAGQAIRLGSLFNSHAFAVISDLKRIEAAKSSCMDYMPLGAAAFAGTHLNINLEKLAKDLAFSRAPQNTYFAVGDRDFIIDALAAQSMLAVHISRMCEEFIFLSSTFVGLLKLSPEWSSGSSIMPNKRNPDIIEIARAKMARVIAAHSEAANIVRAVIPSYGSDLHELKRTLVRSTHELTSTVKIMTKFVTALSVDKNVAERLLNLGHILATDITNALVEKGSTFRDAYLKIKSSIIEADKEGLQIHQNKDFEQTTFIQAIENRKNSGGSAKAQLLKSIDFVDKYLKQKS